MCIYRGGGGGWSKFRKINSEIEGSTVLRTVSTRIMNIHEIGASERGCNNVSPEASRHFYFSIIIAVAGSTESAAARCSPRRLSILSDHLYLMKSHKDTRVYREEWW